MGLNLFDCMQMHFTPVCFESAAHAPGASLQILTEALMLHAAYVAGLQILSSADVSHAIHKPCHVQADFFYCP